jgi:Tfp pilus assembly protein PilF
VLGGYGFVPPEEAWPKGKAGSQSARSRAESRPDAYGTMAFAAFYLRLELERNEGLFRKALSINPNNPGCTEFYASYLHAMGDWMKPTNNPHCPGSGSLSGWVRDDKGWILLSRHRPEEAAVEFRKAQLS